MFFAYAFHPARVFAIVASAVLTLLSAPVALDRNLARHRRLRLVQLLVDATETPTGLIGAVAVVHHPILTATGLLVFEFAGSH